MSSVTFESLADKQVLLLTTVKIAIAILAYSPERSMGYGPHYDNSAIRVDEDNPAVFDMAIRID
jgi:hypothetical protein